MEIVGKFPEGRYDSSAAINIDYLNEALDAYPRDHKGQKHSMADRCLNLVWLRVPDTAAFQQVADQIEHSPLLRQPGRESAKPLRRASPRFSTPIAI